VNNINPGAVAAAAGLDRNFAGKQFPSSNDSQRATRGPELRPYQRAVIARVAAEACRRLLLVAPTGSGKTVIAAAIIKAAVERGKRAVVLTNRRELTKQASQKLHAVGIDHGIVQAGFPTRPGERVQVASIQTLHARAVRTSSIGLPPADLVIADEAHHARARTWRRLIEAYPVATIIGLTATPCRADGRGLGNVFESMIEVSTVADLIAEGFLVPTKVYAPLRPDLTGVRVERSDYVERQLGERMNTPKLVGDIIEHWFKLNPGRRPTVVFAVDVAHSVHLRDEFRRSGILAEQVDGSTPIEERDAILTRLASGAVEVICNCAVLTEGWDCPEVSCIVLARPTKSLALYRQMTGRSLRPAPGKTDALILDHAGAVFEHGFPEDPIEWTLAGDRRAENTRHAARGTYQTPALATCPECSAVRFEGQPCPVCHWRPVTKAKWVEISDGELGRVVRNRSVAAPMHTANDQQEFYAQLLWVAREKGYQRGWAAHKFKEKFGKWPRPPMRIIKPMLPTDTMRAWLKSRQIAFAKAMAKTFTATP
jgi:DNA repair protein RadD